MATKPGRMITYLGGLLLTKSDHVVLRNHMTNLHHDISTIRVLMATKLGRMITYLDGLQPIKSHDPLIMYSIKIT